MNRIFLASMISVAALTAFAMRADAAPVMSAAVSIAPDVQATHAESLIIPVQETTGEMEDQASRGEGGANDGGDGGVPCKYQGEPGACGNIANRSRKIRAGIPPGCYALGDHIFCPRPRYSLKFNDEGCCHRHVKRTVVRIKGKRVRGYLYGKWHCHAKKLHRHCLPRGKR